MSVPLLHFIFGCAGNIVPVKIYASVARGAAEICRNYQRRSRNCMLGTGPGGVASAAFASDVVDI